MDENPNNNASDDNASDPQGCQGCDESRRKLLTGVTYSIGGVIAAGVVSPVLGFIGGPVFRKPEHDWRDVGPLSDFKVGETKLVSYRDSSSVPWSGVTSEAGAWLRRDSETSFTAFSISCRHLGCPVRWEQNAGLFLCPCHGGAYYPDGNVAAGPPPEPLKQLQTRIKNDRVEIYSDALPLTTTTEEQLDPRPLPPSKGASSDGDKAS